MRKGLLIVDRGSRESDVKHELEEICSLIKEKTEYVYSNYCFLEVVPPFIDEGIHNSMIHNLDLLTIVPYFLYPGMKLKDSVKQCASFCFNKSIKLVITKPLSYHHLISDLVKDRIKKVKEEKKILDDDHDLDILIIGHGSSDRRAHDAFVFTVNKIIPSYRNVQYCFLELDEPNIDEGVRLLLKNKPKKIIVVPYFLHKGIHIKQDVLEDLNKALKKYGFSDVFITEHFGVDEKLVDLILDRAAEVEKRIVI